MTKLKISCAVQILVAASMVCLPDFSRGESSAIVFHDNCLRCHTLDKVASTAGEGTESEQRESLLLLFRNHPKKPVEFDKNSMIDYLTKEFATRAKK